MQIGVIGLNHKSAGLELREKIALSSLKRFGADCSLHGELSYVLLTTCNRTEIYFSSNDLAGAHSYLLTIFRNECADEFEHTIYSYFGRDCFFHLAKVTCGMDSALIGETEIQGQVKSAYECATQYKSLSSELHFLFQKCLKIGKEFRSLPQERLSIEDAIFQRANSLFPHLDQKKILFVGISEINQKIVHFLKMKHLKEITCCNRTMSRSESFSKSLNINVLPWEELTKVFDFDVIIYGTKAPSYLLRRHDVVMPMERKLIFDLSVPRNVDPEIGALKNVVLFNIDEIGFTVDKSKQLASYQRVKRMLPFIFASCERQYYLFKRREQMVKTALCVG